MATLIEVTTPAPTRPRSVTALPGDDRSGLRASGLRLSRGRGGTFSSTVEAITFDDQSRANTDLIRLNPNIDAYSLDFAGTSPRQLCHYREADWQSAARRSAVLWREEITRVLALGYPATGVADLTGRLRSAGYPVGTGTIREHEAIAATQAAIWHLTNGLRLDTTPREIPLRATSRLVGFRSRDLTCLPSEPLAWHTSLPAGQVAHLDLEFAGEPQLGSFWFTATARTARHELSVSLESSRDGRRWQQVSGGTVLVPATRSGDHRVRRRLGLGATLSASSPGTGERGHRFYRLSVRGPDDRDSLLRFADIGVSVIGARFANPERVVYLYDLLLSGSVGVSSLLHPRPDETAPGPHRTRHNARLLIGAATPGGPGVFTPLVTLASPVADGTFGRPRTRPSIH